MTEKNAPPSCAISMATQIRQYDAVHIAQYGRTWLPCMPPDAAIGQVIARYRPGGHHGHQFWRKKWSCGVVKSLSEASIQKA